MYISNLFARRSFRHTEEPAAQEKEVDHEFKLINTKESRFEIQDERPRKSQEKEGREGKEESTHSAEETRYCKDEEESDRNSEEEGCRGAEGTKRRNAEEEAYGQASTP